MYTFIAIADVHLGAKLFNLPELAQDLKDLFVKACDEALARKVTYLVIVGDLFDSNKLSPDLIHFVAEQVERLAANGIMILGIAGDHDKPINNCSWIYTAGVMPVTTENTFIGYDYSDNSADNIAKLAALPKAKRENVEWVFLHGQVPELFGFTEDKKKLDIKSIDPINLFPKLKGVILGDIHSPIASTIADPTQTKSEPWIGYCGSLGIVKTDEVDTKIGLLYFDGIKLSRIPFKMDRRFIRLNLGDAFSPINWVETYSRFFTNYKGKKPVFIIEHDSKTKKLLPEIGPLYDVGVVRVSAKRVSVGNKEETFNIRSELKTNDRISDTLKECAQEQKVFDLVFTVLKADDPKTILDKFKVETITPSKPLCTLPT
jgi:DNA repair exonuclease SbcCD nuclease subunit